MCACIPTALLSASRFRGIGYARPNSASTSSTSTDEDSLARDFVVPAQNGRVFVAWHPEREIPYEHTRPLKATQQEIQAAAKEAETALKIPPKKLYFRNIRNEVEYLKKITYTNKHRWYNQPRDKDITIRPHDRDGL
ncbi:39S ribosomal protein L42 [Tropilaelaps mercedesae]|uniref:Large ribosomal subunit protein mL42 n=1 Tax=Tropilaelaps mercedesae TaxID=418985 RepID=A0A1V9XPI1_9ACAR|nr:39S ribosomal protein L42 [Tropilaelaps mercedesae]